MNTNPIDIDVLCVGHACYDLIFQVDHHPAADEKIFAEQHQACGGGPTANGAVAVSRLGFKAAFAGFLGTDLYGDRHLSEFQQENIDTTLLIRGHQPTPVSIILVKPDGTRALVNYKGETRPLSRHSLDFTRLDFKTVLFDGHEPEISVELATYCTQQQIPMVLDAGSIHKGTLALMDKVDYLVCSEKFARQFAGTPEAALSILAEKAPVVIITLGQDGLIWKTATQQGQFRAFNITAMDTTGAGDAFHGAFSAAIADNMRLDDALYYASATGALCCTKIGARTGLPDGNELTQFLNTYRL